MVVEGRGAGAGGAEGGVGGGGDEACATIDVLGMETMEGVAFSTTAAAAAAAAITRAAAGEEG